MFIGCLFFDNISFTSKKIYPSNFSVNYFNQGFLVFDSSSSFELFLVQESEFKIKILNPLENDFPEDFSCLNDVVSYLSTKDYYSQLSIILYNDYKQEISLVRDLFGIKPLLYSHSPKHFISFSSSLSALINFDQSERNSEVNLLKISQYLTWLSDGDLYSESTFFSNIKNVQPGYSCLINSDKIIMKQPIQFDTSKWNTFSTLNEFGEEFKYLFRNSIKNLLASNNTVASTLSGGLDSSSICCMIREIDANIKINTIYVNTDTSLTDETKYANEVVEKIKSSHQVILSPLDNLFESAQLHISLYGHPEYMFNGSSLNRSVIQSAQSSGCVSLFSGHSGDGIVGYGGDYVVQLFNTKEWGTLRDLISGSNHESLNYEDDRTETILVYELIYSLLARKKENLNLSELTKLILETSNFFKIPLSFFIKNGWRKVSDFYKLPGSIINNTSYLNVDDTIYEFPLKQNLSVFTSKQYESIFSVQSVLINEQFYILDHYYGTEHKFPFYDKSLFELSLAVPNNIKYDNGRRRGHLREAMKGILPETIRTRTSKANFGLYGRITTLNLYHQSMDLLNVSGDIWIYVKKKAFDKYVALLKTDKLPIYIYNQANYYISKTIYLAIWLDLYKRKAFISTI